MNEYVDTFIEVRNSLILYITELVDCYSSDIWDRNSKYTIPKDIRKFIESNIKTKFDLPAEYLPKYIVQLNPTIEIAIQYYFNSNTDLLFLGQRLMNLEPFDFYKDEENNFYCRYGHIEENVFMGNKVTCQAEYYIYNQSPLGVAYEIALDGGFIS